MSNNGSAIWLIVKYLIIYKKYIFLNYSCNFHHATQLILHILDEFNNANEACFFPCELAVMNRSTGVPLSQIRSRYLLPRKLNISKAENNGISKYKYSA